jgi:ABC-type multidrug transport system fused ATPase/permease subunit
LTVWWRDFFRLAGWFPGTSAGAIVFSCLAALLEGVGLAALIPALQASLGGSVSVVGPLMRFLPHDPSRWALFGIAVFALLAVGAVVSRLTADILLLRLRTAVEQRARERMGRALLHMSWPAFLSLRLGDIAKAQVMEGLQIGVGTQVFVQALGATLASAAYIVVAMTISVSMTLYTLAFGGIVAVFYSLIGRWARRHSEELSSIVSSIGERVTEIFQGLKFLRATGLTGKAEAQASALYESWRRSYFMSQLYALGMRQGFELLGLCFIAVFLLFSLNAGQGGLATALVFLAVFYRLAPRLLAAQDGLHQARTYHSWYVTWQDRLVNAEQSTENVEGGLVPAPTCRIELRSVTYQYPGAPRPVLESVSVALAPRSAVAIIGPSGCGKTTLLDLVTGLIQPTAGSVALDGVDLRDIDLRRWRAKIGLVQQEPLLLHGSILENICWGQLAPDAVRARRALEAAGAAVFVDALPNGIDTPVGERGGRLSGGQRQRIALARALYRQPDLLILDEPTSALDRDSEQEVLASLRLIKGVCSMLIVTHSTQVAQICDEVITLEAGRLVSTADSRSAMQNR